ncbi:MAG: polysaccharide deacetylase family protein [Gammaproteobacteria bacterium]|nr:polysaccharide deacetylase family protein [Gammaproteobacteria bacterium]
MSNVSSPLTSVRPEIFKQHINYLVDNNFNVWPLSKVLNYLESARSLPPKTVVITFDDAYASVYNEAFPVLRAKGLPFTVFVTTQYIGDANQNFMSWNQLRELQKMGAEIGNHSHSHAHLIRKHKNETQKQWKYRVTNEINQAQFILEREVSTPIRVFAYPYGEFSNSLKEILRDSGYIGLGQHSGVLSRTSDFQAIARFPMATGYDEINDFAMKIITRDLPVTILSPVDGVLLNQHKLPELKLQLLSGDYNKSAFACYATRQGRAIVSWENFDKGIVNITAKENLTAGRSKFNCTAPSNSEKNVYYWFSFLWMKPEPDGRWYQE